MWLDAHRPVLEAAAPGRALDVACGRGRNAFVLAALGFDVVAVDVSDVAVDAVRAGAASTGAAVTAVRADLERDPLPAPLGYDAIVVASYLQRSLFGTLADALTPGGLLVYETFTRDDPHMNPAYALAPGELRSAFGALDVVAYEEGGGRAGIVARRP